jgi:hypothetical protein
MFAYFDVLWITLITLWVIERHGSVSMFAVERISRLCGLNE